MQLQWDNAISEAIMVLSQNEAGRLIWREQTEEEKLIENMMEDAELFS